MDHKTDSGQQKKSGRSYLPDFFVQLQETLYLRFLL